MLDFRLTESAFTYLVKECGKMLMHLILYMYIVQYTCICIICYSGRVDCMATQTLQ